MERADWRSYDRVAEHYDRVWGSRFDAAARHLVNRARLGPDERLLDVGTGTGAILAAAEAMQPRPAPVAIDRSAAMLARARARVPRLLGVAAQAAELPFRDRSFDAVSFGFVLSHLRDEVQALREAHRVLRPRGRLAASCWGPMTDIAQQAWRDLLISVLDESAVDAAAAEVAPLEGRFGDSGNLRRAFSDAGFNGVEVHEVALEVDLGVDEFLEDRTLGSAGRYARHALGEAAWETFRTRALEDLRRRLGSRVRLNRMVLIAVGRRP